MQIQPQATYRNLCKNFIKKDPKKKINLVDYKFDLRTIGIKKRELREGRGSRVI